MYYITIALLVAACIALLVIICVPLKINKGMWWLGIILAVMGIIGNATTLYLL